MPNTIKFRLKVLNSLNLIPKIVGNTKFCGNWDMKKGYKLMKINRNIEKNKELWTADVSQNIDSLIFSYILTTDNNKLVFYENFHRSLKDTRTNYDEFGYIEDRCIIKLAPVTHGFEFRILFPLKSFLSPNISQYTNTYFAKCDVLDEKWDSDNSNLILRSRLINESDCQITHKFFPFRFSPLTFNQILIRSSIQPINVQLSLLYKDSKSNEVPVSAFFPLDSFHESTLFPISLTDDKNEFVKFLQIEILRILPYKNQDYFFQKENSLLRVHSLSSLLHFDSSHPPSFPLFIGHRGSGSSFPSKEKAYHDSLENSLDSFLNAHKQKNLTFVEFDVLLTRDNIPIVYHDFSTSLVLPDSHQIQISIEELDFHLLSSLDFKLTEDPNPYNSTFYKNKIFPKLEQLFEKLPEDLGFNIEIKWPQRMKSGGWEGGKKPVKNLNFYIDTILEVCLKKTNSRKIFFSSFSADACSLLSSKQSLYPVMFLNQCGGNYENFLDSRTQTLKSAIEFAYSERLLGVVAHCSGVAKEPHLVNEAHSLDLLVFCWGKDLNKKKMVEQMIQLKVDAIVLDNIKLAS